jgi:N-methylhydantoinase A
MASHGGLVSLAEAARLPAATVLSGPAGGVLGALAVARRAGYPRLLTFDMGGTSTDVALADDAVPFTTAVEVDGLPVHLPAVDVRSIGAGGGSVVRLDEGGAVRVGPQSAGARPGPAAYGLGGTRPTVTDAHVVLGRLSPEHVRLAGLRLDAAAARGAFEALAQGTGLGAAALAQAALDVADAAMARALRSVSVAVGQDPASCTLVAFGGAGPLHACGLAADLGLERVLVPASPGALSALGLVTAERVATAARSILRRGPAGPPDAGAVARAFGELGALAAARLGTAPSRVERFVEARYAGQSWELVVPWPDDGDLRAAFDRRHLARFGYAQPEAAVEWVTLRVRARAPAWAALPRPPALTREPEGRTRLALPDGRWVDAPVLPRFNLPPGAGLAGPALLTQPDTTTYVAPGWRAEVGGWGDLLLVPDPDSRLDSDRRAEDNSAARP